MSSWLLERLSVSFANTNPSNPSSPLEGKSVKGESRGYEGKRTVSRAKESFVSEGDDTQPAISYLYGSPTIGGVLRN